MSILDKLMNRVTVNGKTYSGGSSIVVTNGRVIIDGRDVTDKKPKNGILEIKITGDAIVEKIQTDCSVTCGLVVNNIDAGGSVSCDDVGGDIDAGGSVHAANVAGDVDAGGSITCGLVGGNVDAGGSVHHG